ncbi:hypothetical protein [Dongia sp.]|uniref:hypothetical protein n=1 Tax=Dongia sp. TaxID=1977262 RepID=UPI0037504D72
MKVNMLAALASLLLLAAVTLAIPAQAATIDFTGAGTVNYEDVSQGYGDSAEADIGHRTLGGGNNWGQFAAQTADHAEYWADTNYSGDNAIFAVSNGNKLEVSLLAGAGLGFTSISFDLGGFPNIDKTTAFRLYDAGWNLLLSDDTFAISGTTGGLVTLAVNTTALYFQMGDDWNTGVRSLSFQTAAVATTPIPAALPLFASALGALGFAARRRRKTAAL